MTFASGLDLRKHIDLAHNGRDGGDALTCRYCDAPFSTRAALRDHLAEHAALRPFRCETCDVRFSSQVALTRHARRVHERRAPHECRECGKRFYERHAFEAVERTDGSDNEEGAPDIRYVWSGVTRARG